MNQDEARKAAVEKALEKIEPGMSIGLGSGRAVFALTDLIGERLTGQSIQAVCASPATRRKAEEANISVLDLRADIHLDIAFDGADEIDGNFTMIKGGGAALLTEKLVLSAARHVVIMVEENKMVERLGSTRLLPVEIVRFGWQTTRERVLRLTNSAVLREEAGLAVITSENHYLLDIDVPEIAPDELAEMLKLTLGVVDHGLFLDQADEVIIGRSNGSIEIRSRSKD